MSQANPRVFITQESSHLNYGPAEEFGDIVFLTAQEVSPVPGSLINADIMAQMERKLLDFDFDHDYLAPSGSPTVCGMAFLTLGKFLGDPVNRRPDCLRVLRWSNRDRCYQPITIKL